VVAETDYEGESDGGNETWQRCGKCGSTMVNNAAITELDKDFEDAKWMLYESNTYFTRDRCPLHVYPNVVEDVWAGVWVIVCPGCWRAAKARLRQ
jgi:hypothetical protein